MLASSVLPTVVDKSLDNDSSAFYTSVQKKSQEESRNKTISRDTQGYKSNCDDRFLSLSSLYFQHCIGFIEQDDGKNQWRTIYEVIDGLYL